MANTLASLTDDALAKLVSNVTNTMLGMRFVPAHDTATQSTLREWMTTLSLRGPTPLTVAISSTPSSCKSLSAAMLALAPNEVDVMMARDTLNEIVNMAAAQVRSALAIDQALGLPEFHQGDASLDPSACRVVQLASGPINILLWLSDQPTKSQGDRPL